MTVTNPQFLHTADWHMPGPLGKPMNLPVKVVVLHHTAEPLTGDPIKDAQATARVGISRFGKMSYSYLVHPNRIVFEGQGSHVGAHTENHNSTALSISLMGNYDVDDCPDSMVYDACYTLWALKSFGLVIHRPLVVPHQAFKSTACPGRHAVAKCLPMLRAVAASDWAPVS